MSEQTHRLPLVTPTTNNLLGFKEYKVRRKQQFHDVRWSYNSEPKKSRHLDEQMSKKSQTPRCSLGTNVKWLKIK
ncbi:unnamed protein product [Caenorhabditis nigoni]